MTKFYPLLLSASLFFIGCKTASKAYNKGDYADAIELGIKKLQKDPSDADTRELVKSAYSYAVNQSEASIRNLSAGNEESRYEAILREYDRLQDLYETIQQSPAAAGFIRPTNYGDYVQTYRGKAADVHLANADKWMEQRTKQAYREAYNEYNRAYRYRNTTDVKQKRDQAYDLAVTKILVVPIQNYGGYSYHTNYQLQQFQNEVMRTLAYNINDNFVRFYSEWDMHGKNFEPDQVLEMNLGRIRIGQPYDEQSSREVSKQVVAKETVYKADSVVKEYATVRARITNTRRTLVSEGELYLTIRDTRGRILWNDRFTGQHRWQTEFATYTGDERALSDNDRSQLNRNTNNNPPREEEIMNELYRQIQLDLSSRLRGYFARF
ncbi:hypothetical protein [Flavisolibacter nicotianae]|uniref:hypothetical protein n=1 Tax=Flavisolibacter nicotianae TaxID=2364882 RepID=UPI000EAEB6CC|nr:hypothetical protein [Flavisolibacter nicotianae]